MKVVITGGAGFVGLLLGQRLAALGSITNSTGQTKPVEEIAVLRRSAFECHVREGETAR